MGLMSVGGPNKASYKLDMTKTVTNATTVLTFLKKGTYRISGSFTSEWICSTEIQYNGVRKGFSQNGEGNGSLDFTVDAVPNDVLKIIQITDQQNVSNRLDTTYLTIEKIK